MLLKIVYGKKDLLTNYFIVEQLPWGWADLVHAALEHTAETVRWAADEFQQENIWPGDFARLHPVCYQPAGVAQREGRDRGHAWLEWQRPKRARTWTVLRGS